MKYASKIAETTPNSTTNTNNQQNPPDAEYSSPWRGAAIGGTFGGLLATAMGYLYGHRGKWLAYDAIAGGLTGGAGGYAIDAHNRGKAQAEAKSKAQPSSYSRQAIERERQMDDKEWEERYDRGSAEWDRIQQEGGFPSWSEAGTLGWLKNTRRKLQLMTIAAHIKDKNQARQRYRENRDRENSWGKIAYYPLKALGATTKSYE